MLEFIVLGQIPGTDIVITFSWAVAVATVVVGTSLLYRIHSQHNISKLVELEEITI